MLGFVGYQLWGTGLSTAAAQADLQAEFVASLETAPARVVTTTSTTEAPSSAQATSTTIASTTQTTVTQAVVNPEFDPGDVVGQIQIPAIELDFFVVSGVGVEELRLGPGHFTDTPLPGQLGNSAIAGHRTTYGQPFHNLDQLTSGDEIVLTTAYGTFIYEVSGLRVVEPTDYAVVSTIDPTVATLTLTTCHPKWSAAQRLIVTADLNVLRSDPLLAEQSVAVENSDEATASTLPSETTSSESEQGISPVETSSEASNPVTEDDAASAPTDSTTSQNSQGQEVFAAGWFHDSAAVVQSIIWMVILFGIRMAIIRVSQRRKSWWPMLPLGLLPAVVGLYFFYVNVNNLVPPNL
jgi:sortase A